MDSSILGLLYSLKSQQFAVSQQRKFEFPKVEKNVQIYFASAGQSPQNECCCGLSLKLGIMTGLLISIFSNPVSAHHFDNQIKHRFEIKT